MFKKHVWLWAALLVGATSLYGYEVTVHTDTGEEFLVSTEDEDYLGSACTRVLHLTEGEAQSMWVELAARHHCPSAHQGGDLGYPRNYNAQVSDEEKNAIRFIITTLAEKSLFDINREKGKLEAAGDRIDRVHPLRFLTVVFTHEDLKVGIRNVRGRGWIWKQFFGGLKESLSNECKRKNITEAQLKDFAANVGVDLNVFCHAVRDQNWDMFIDLLITHVPRGGDGDKYDF